jgi:hypothetical protein
MFREMRQHWLAYLVVSVAAVCWSVLKDVVL